MLLICFVWNKEYTTHKLAILLKYSPSILFLNKTDQILRIVLLYISYFLFSPINFISFYTKWITFYKNWVTENSPPRLRGWLHLFKQKTLLFYCFVYQLMNLFITIIAFYKKRYHNKFLENRNWFSTWRNYHTNMWTIIVIIYSSCILGKC